jgi:hypothetical protein
MTGQNENSLPVADCGLPIADCENCENYVLFSGDAIVSDVLTAVEIERCELDCWLGLYRDTRPKFCKYFQPRGDQ